MPSSPEPKPEHEEDDLLLEPADDVPVNKITSFNGRLQQYLHSSSTTQETSNATSTVTSHQRKTRTKVENQAEETTASPKRRKATTQTTTTTTITTPRITRSRSRSTATSTPSSIPTSTPPSPLSGRQTPIKLKRKRGTPIKTPTPPNTPSLLRDTIPKNLVLLLVGVNPGIMTGITGHAYAHPSNLFWKLLHSSGITSIRHPPADTYKLPALYSVGNTNIVVRPTRDASMLSKAEMDAGVPVLEAKVAAQRPEVVCLVGKSIWEAVWRVRKGRGIRKEEFRYGWQDEAENMGRCEGWEGAPIFVATTTSGLAAGMRPAEKEAIWAELGKWVVKRRVERGLEPVVVKGEVVVKNESVAVVKDEVVAEDESVAVVKDEIVEPSTPI